MTTKNGNRLAVMRRAAVLSQRGLAEKSGVAQSTIANIEGGGRVRPSTLQKLAKALGCSPRDLAELLEEVTT